MNKISNILLTYNRGYQWFLKDGVSVKGYLFDEHNHYLETEELVSYFEGVNSSEEFKCKLEKANGIFSVIIEKEETVFAACDITRTFPLFYCILDDKINLTDDPDNFRSLNIPFSLDQEASVLFEYSGYVCGNKTLLKGINQIQAGEYIYLDRINSFKRTFFYEYLSETFTSKDYSDLKVKLKGVLENVGKRLILSLKNRPVALPLSGGFDSRLIAYLLKKNDYSNVFCFTYGKESSPELSNSKRTAEKLGYKWIFVNHRKHYDQFFIKDIIFRDYVKFSTNYTSNFFLQEYFTALYLSGERRLPSDTVFIPGHSGDAIAGSHLKFVDNPHFSVRKYILRNNFNRLYPYKKNISVIIKFIDQQIPDNPHIPSFLKYENWNFKERQSKFIVNSSKIWDYFGYQYLLPLWDLELVEFFKKLPFEYKQYKKLYDDVLKDLFVEEGIYYDEDELHIAKLRLGLTKRLFVIKELFPFLQRKKNIWKNDNLGFEQLSKDFLSELKESGVDKDIILSNGIFSSWYLQQVKNELSEG